MLDDKFFDVLIDWAVNHPDKKAGVSDLAKKAGYSKWYLNRTFAQRRGISLGQFLCRERMAAAAEVLRTTDATIAKIAEQFHYDTQQTFTRAFTRHFGLPPGEWRKGNVANSVSMTVP